MVRILITADGEFTGSRLDVGGYYFCEKDDSGTLLQNSLFHSLLDIFYHSGVYSYPNVKTYEELRNYVKLNLGAGYKSYVFITLSNKGIKKGRVKKFEDVPENIATDEDGNKMLWGELKSWSKYNKKERTNTIQNLITEMINLNVHSKKFYDILQTLQKNSVNKYEGMAA